MEKYIQIILFVFLFAGAGCSSWINVEPENSVTYENYFKSEKDAQALLFTLEIKLRDMGSPFVSTELHTDKRYPDLTGSYGHTSAYTYLETVSANFEPYYAIIAAADVIIDNAFRFPLDESVIRPYVLQAYFAKAYAYFKLATDFGEAPIIKDGQSYKKYGKSSETEVLDEAEKWALLALDIPIYENLKLGGLTLTKQFASKGAVTSLLAKLYAWRAGVEGKTEYWAKAEEMCTQVIENKVGYYTLEADPELLCSSGLKKDSKESIWEIYRDPQELGGVFYHGVLGDIISFPIDITENIKDELSNYVTKETVREYYDESDLRRESYFWATDADSIFMIVADGKTIPSTERKDSDSVSVKYVNQDIVKAYFTKFRFPTYIYYSWSSTPSFRGMEQNVVKCRLADIMLLRAECRMRQGKPNAVEDLNAVRRRSYLPDENNVYHCDYPNADDTRKGLANDLQLTIFREREKELLQEGHRYYDARRNGVEYVQRFFSGYSHLNPSDIREGALYAAIVKTAFENNDLLRQNVYWNRREQ